MLKTTFAGHSFSFRSIKNRILHTWVTDVSKFGGDCQHFSQILFTQFNLCVGWNIHLWFLNCRSPTESDKPQVTKSHITQRSSRPRVSLWRALLKRPFGWCRLLYHIPYNTVYHSPLFNSTFSQHVVSLIVYNAQSICIRRQMLDARFSRCHAMKTIKVKQPSENVQWHGPQCQQARYLMQVQSYG